MSGLPYDREEPARSRTLLGPLPLLVLFLAGLAVMWALASPVGGAPDEAQHITYAWGMASGDAWTSEVVEVDLGSEEIPVVVPSVPIEVPDTLTAIIDHRCYSFDATQLASDCSGDLEAADSTGSSIQSTYMVRYPPSYYLPAGLILHAGLAAGLDGPATLLLLRLISGLSGVALLAAAMFVLRRHFDRLSVLLTTVLAVPPLAMFIGSAVNPNGVEVASAVLVAAAVVTLRTDIRLDRAPSRAALTALLVGAPLLALVRPLSVAWLGILLVILLVPARSGPGAVWTVPLLRLPLAVAVGAIVSAGAGCGWVYWSVTGRGVESIDAVATNWATVSTADRMALIALQYSGNALGYVGTFGWLDTPLPTGVSMTWVAVVVLLVALAVVSDRRPFPRAWHLGLAVVIAGHAVMIAHTALTGFGWQPRYLLPCLAAALVVSIDSLALASRRSTTLLSIAALGALAVHTFSPAWTYARFRWGFTQPALRFPPAPLPRPRTGRDLWQPVLEPLPFALLAVAVLALGVAAIVVALADAHGSRQPRDDAEARGRAPAPG